MLDARARPVGWAPAPVTFAAYGRSWIERCVDEELKSAGDYETVLETHLIPRFGDLALEDVQPTDIRELVRELKTKKGGHTVRNVYSVLHNLYAHALDDELVLKTPCTLLQHDLPAKKHKRIDFRAMHVFERWEVTRILEAATIPKRWRTIYAFAFLTGARPGEVFAIRWEHLELAKKPLGRALIVDTYSRKRGESDSNKTEELREVPILPSLAGFVGWWREHGYREFTGCEPWPKAVVFPRFVGGLLEPLTDKAVLQRFHRDLKRLGLRTRRFHDARRTYVSLTCGTEGIDRAVMRRVTHAGRLDVHDGYNEIAWEVTCREAKKMKIDLTSRPSSGRKRSGK